MILSDYIFIIQRKQIGSIIRQLCEQKGLVRSLSIPPKFSVSNTVGFIKGKSAIRVHRELLKTTGLSFWAKGYFVSTLGLDEEMLKRYIREQDIKK
jgi:putative transposase